MDIRGKLTDIYSLEQLSGQSTCIHSLHPLAKIIVTVVYIICVVSHGRYDFFSLAPYLFYPVIMIALAEIPYYMILKRTMIAVPFCIFAGVSNLILDREVYITIDRLVITTGLISFFAILLRTCLCVSAILILVAVTPFSQLTSQLVRMHVPNIFVNLIEMIYRYISVLVEEAGTMLTAYRMRSPDSKWPAVQDAGAFLGQLFLRSMDRAERIYNAMKCRGYGMGQIYTPKQTFKWADIIFLFGGCVFSILALIFW